MSTGIEGSGQNGALLMNEIYEMVRKLSDETEKESRETERLDAKQELQAGLAGAEHMHEAANSARSGALVSGLTLAATAGAETYFAVGVCDAGNSDAAAKAAQNEFDISRNGEKFGQLFNEGYQAAAKDHEADAQTDAAMAKAAGHDADQASDAIKAAREVESSATESYREILRSQHDSIMATLAKRG